MKKQFSLPTRLMICKAMYNNEKFKLVDRYLNFNCLFIVVPPNSKTKFSSNPKKIKKDKYQTRPLLFSKGEIRTLDLTGMSRALSPTELPCLKLFILSYAK